jgi:hypothetical protein
MRATGGKTQTTSPPKSATKTIEKSMSVAKVNGGLAEPTFDEIRQRAYEIYLARGGAPGNSTSDWLQAERELKAERVSVR